MKKLKLSPVLAAGVAAAVQIHQGQALATPPPPQQTVTYTNETAFSVTNKSYGGNVSIDLLFSQNIVNADELISISEGGTTSSESGSFALSVVYTNSTAQQLYTDTFTGQTLQFNTISDKTFTEGTIDGLNFVLSSTTYNTVETVPAGTVFTFAVVPEPGTLALAAMGAGGLWLAVRRRTSRQG